MAVTEIPTVQQIKFVTDSSRSVFSASLTATAENKCTARTKPATPNARKTAIAADTKVARKVNFEKYFPDRTFENFRASQSANILWRAENSIG